MELNSHLSELSTSTQSSGYSSSTASSSLTFIDDREHSKLNIDNNNNNHRKEDNDESFATKLIITITLVKFEDDEKVLKIEFFLRNVRSQ